MPPSPAVIQTPEPYEYSSCLDRIEDLNIARGPAKLSRAQAMVNQTMNYQPTLHAPIHLLPPEILSYIFQLVRDAQPGYLGNDLKPFPATYPETLILVCSHWHRIAMDSGRLWSHIQISHSRCLYSNHRRLFARAKVFAARADPLPMDIQIISGSGRSYYPRLDEFCTSVITRIKAFSMSTICCSSSRILIFQRWLETYESGLLNELVLTCCTCHNHRQFQRIEASEAPVHSDSLLLQMPHKHLEQRLLSIRYLQLTGVYFHWTSQAYHGLVELRLFPLPGILNIDISQPQLKSILTASPRLRKLYFGLQIIDVLPQTDPTAAVSLDELEVVNLCLTKQVGQCGPLLQLLAPGSKPVQLSMNCRLTTSTPFPGNDFMEFFARSNVTKLHIESFDPQNTSKYQPLVLLELLKYMPSLRALSLRCFHLGRNQPRGRESSPDADGTELNLHTFPQLDTVHLRDCTIDLNYFRRVIQVVPVQELKYKGCRFYSMKDGHSSRSNNLPPRDNFPSTFSHVYSLWPMHELGPWA